jgi:hypothetical protein
MQRVDMLLDGNFKMNVRMANVETPELLTMNNPNYEKLIRDYNHLGNVVIDDCDTKDRFPIHLVLGNGEYERIKTSTKPVIGGDHEPVAEKTKLGCQAVILMSRYRVPKFVKNSYFRSN